MARVIAGVRWLRFLSPASSPQPALSRLDRRSIGLRHTAGHRAQRRDARELRVPKPSRAGERGWRSRCRKPPATQPVTFAEGLDSPRRPHGRSAPRTGRSRNPVPRSLQRASRTNTPPAATLGPRCGEQLLGLCRCHSWVSTQRRGFDSCIAGDDWIRRGASGNSHLGGARPRCAAPSATGRPVIIPRIDPKANGSKWDCQGSVEMLRGRHRLGSEWFGTWPGRCVDSGVTQTYTRPPDWHVRPMEER